MKISVVIPVYNGEQFIRDCVLSVLEQTHPPADVIVVNDGSTDGTETELAAFGSSVHVIRQANQGRSRARNAGIRAANGDYVAFLDADDRFLPHHLEQLAEAATTDRPEIVHDALRLPYLSDREQDEVLRRRARDRREDHLRTYFLSIQTSMIKRSWFLDQDLWFKAGFSITEDALFMWSAILLGARVQFVPRSGTLYGVHEGNSSIDHHRTYLLAVEAYRELDAFVADRGLDVSQANQDRLVAGRRHAQIMASLMSLYERSPDSSRRVLRSFLFRAGISGADRVRCLIGQLWPYFPFARHRSVVRRVFGYTAVRMLDGAAW